MAQMKRLPMGIDLGTAYTRVAFYDGKRCTMIPDEQGNSAMPSYLAFTDSGVLIGEAAKRQASQNPTNTIFDVIRLIGKRYSDPSVQSDMRLWPFKVRASIDGKLLVEVLWNGKLSQFTPVDICSMILIAVKENAETKLKVAVTEAVITVPVCFNYEQRQALKQAGTIARLNVLQIISAPAASALFYGMERLRKNSNIIVNIARELFSEPQEHNMVIFDLGAGTLDVAAVTIKENVCKVIATAGDIHLGGSDFDNNLINHFVNLVKEREKEDISSNPESISNLRTSCEEAKISLSLHSKITVPVNTPLYNDIAINFPITKTKLHALNKHLFSKCIDVIGECLGDAKMDIMAVHEVILLGGSTRIPLLQSTISDVFKGKKMIVTQNLEATAYGAAFQAFFVSESVEKYLTDANSLSLYDVAPFSLGLKDAKGEMFIYVPKNTTIPTERDMTFLYGDPKRAIFCFEVYEVDGRLPNQNSLLGKFQFFATDFAPFGHDIALTFKVCVDGTLTVTAKEFSSGIRNDITIAPNDTEDCKRRVWEALIYKNREIRTIQASPPKSFTRSSTWSKWDQLMEKGMLSKLLSMAKERSENIMGETTRQYVEPEEYAVGIDFGTTYSSVAVWQRNNVKIIENEYGSRSTSSAVAFSDIGRLIGDIVHKERVTTSPENTIPNIKRLISRYCSDQSVHDDRKFLPFRVICGDKNRSRISVHYKNEEKIFAPEQIAAMILSKMKEIAEAHLNSKVSKAVISVPACFNYSQRKAIKDAGVIAGFKVLQLLNETTAVAICYYMQKLSSQSSSEKNLLIFDLGGGNLDVSIVAIKEGIIRVLAVTGDTNLGGEDFDNNMVSHFIEKFMKENKKDIHNKPRSLRRLRAACEKAKRVLSNSSQTVVEVDSLAEEVDFRSVITRKAFVELNESLFKRSIDCVQRCLEDVIIEKNSIDEIVLVGGSSRIPQMQELLQEFFNGKKLCKTMDVDEAVVHGAAIQAAILCGAEDKKKFNIVELQDVTSMLLGLGRKDGDEPLINVLIPKNSPIPLIKEVILATTSDNLTNIAIEVHDYVSACSSVFNLSGLPPKRRGSIRVSFRVDENDILNLQAELINNSARNEIVVTKENGGLTTEEIQKMVEVAAHFKAEDDASNARIAALNFLEIFAYEMKAVSKDSGVSASSQKLVGEAADDVIAWLEINYDAAIDEIEAQRKHLEAIKSKITYLGTTTTP